MKVALADLHWKGHHTPYVCLISKYLLHNGHQVIFITDKDNQRIDELPESDSFQICKIAVPTFEENHIEGITASVVEQKVRTEQVRSMLTATEENDADVLHLLWFDRTIVPYWAATLIDQYNFSVVGTLHRDAFTIPSEGINIKHITKYVSTISLGSVLKRNTLDTLTVHADSIRQRLLQQVSPTSRDNVQVVPAPTPNPSIDCSTEEAKTELNLPSDRRILLFFGGLRYEKGPDVLAKAVTDLNREVVVLFAGSPVDFDESTVTDWDRAANDAVEIINHLEFIPESKVDLFFIAADALVLPYRRQRGISGPMRRACMVGTPVVGNRNSDIGTIINKYSLGETFTLESSHDLRRAITKVVDSDERYEIGLKQYAESQHWKVAGEAFEELYLEVTGT